MDGTPQVVRFDVTTLWHLDAAEWAPSTASISTECAKATSRFMSALHPKAVIGDGDGHPEPDFR
jgi:hypothetical protein